MNRAHDKDVENTAPPASEPAGKVEFDSRGNSVVSGSLSAARGLRIPVTGRPSLLVEVDEIDPLTLDCP